MPTTIPLMALDANVLDQRILSAPASAQTRPERHRVALWIVLAVLGVTIVVSALSPAPADSAATEAPTWLVGP